MPPNENKSEIFSKRKPNRTENITDFHAKLNLLHCRIASPQGTLLSLPILLVVVLLLPFQAELPGMIRIQDLIFQIPDLPLLGNSVEFDGGSPGDFQGSDFIQGIASVKKQVPVPVVSKERFMVVMLGSFVPPMKQGKALRSGIPGCC